MSKTRRRSTAPPSQEIPDAMFAPVAQRLDALMARWRREWPHGVNPNAMLNRQMGPNARAYKSGIRTRVLYEAMLAQIESLAWVERKGEGDAEAS